MKSSRSTAPKPSRPHAPWRATRALPAVFPQALRLRPRSSWGNVRKTRARPSWRLCRHSRSATSQPFYSKESNRVGSTAATTNPQRCPHRSGGRVQEGDQEGGGSAAEDANASRRQGAVLAEERSGRTRILSGRRRRLAGPDQRSPAKSGREITLTHCRVAKQISGYMGGFSCASCSRLTGQNREVFPMA